MSDFRDVTFGEHLFSRIDDNAYLQKLYHNILINYSRRLFRLDEMEEQPVNIGDALTFADVLSKSCGTNLSDIHKTRAQEMVALLYDMYPQDEQVKYYLGSVLANTGNFLGMNRLTPDFENASLLERVFMHFNMDYLSVPSDGEAHFFPAQKEIYDSLSRPYFSYSAPTSMGKSFMMRAFIKQQIMDGAKKNFALLIPTKALINEVTSELIESLTTLLKETDYRIVTSSGSMALETNPGPIDVTEYILFYTKNKSAFHFKKGYVPVGYNKNYNLVLTRSEKVEDWEFTPIKEAVITDAGFASEKEAKKQYGDAWKVILNHLIEEYAFNHADNVVSIRDPHKPTDTVKRLMEQSKSVDHVLEYKREDGTAAYIYHGGALAFYSNKMREIDGEPTVTELLSDFWSHISWAGIAREGGVKLKNGKKPEKLLKQIFDIATDSGDIVLDYHLGSGTTCAVAHKMGLQYIGCEQLDYGQNDVVVRLQNVINGDTTGISKAVNWQGGGSFVYCELAKLNQTIVEEIEAATDDATLSDIYGRMVKSGFISYKVNPADVDAAADDYATLSLGDKKRFLMEILDKNLLYVNYCDIDDEEFGISDEDKAFTRSFYREG